MFLLWSPSHSCTLSNLPQASQAWSGLISVLDTEMQPICHLRQASQWGVDSLRWLLFILAPPSLWISQPRYRTSSQFLPLYLLHPGSKVCLFCLLKISWLYPLFQSLMISPQFLCCALTRRQYNDVVNRMELQTTARVQISGQPYSSSVWPWLS